MDKYFSSLPVIFTGMFNIKPLFFQDTQSNWITGAPIWQLVPFEDMRGAEVICDFGASDVRDVSGGASVNLTSIDECLTNTRFFFSTIDPVEYVCEAEDLVPILAGETMIGNRSYPYYSCCTYALF